MTTVVTDAGWPAERAGALRAGISVGLATGAVGLSFGAVSVASGLSVWQTCALSLLMFTGGSQFALVGVLGVGGGAVAAISTATLLGSRNAFYGLRLTSLLRVRGLRRLFAAQLVIDESTAVAIGQPSERGARVGFWTTGLAVFSLWNLGTALGALGAGAVADPRDLGLDVAAPAAFLALLTPRLRGREPWLVALVAAVVAVASVPLVPIGVPVLLAGLVALVGLRRPRSGAPLAGPRSAEVAQ